MCVNVRKTPGDSGAGVNSIPNPMFNLVRAARAPFQTASFTAKLETGVTLAERYWKNLSPRVHRPRS